ncbi:MAG: EVE domain-containing protein [Alphaproteobacteria bacterium]|jgi:predicted RNA-binding protein with PUA-like domain|nr:EVE domain-containing protein [Alphaproteobacteria bacterium]|tara:strand:- start:389 stop:793 length:405 start_codon:yes stop_codon:yes gene_type:complete
MNYWLLKSEPSTWSWDDQSKVKKEMWDGVRNYQARNNLMKMKKGDLCFFYHSVNEKKIVGIVEVVKEHYPDPTDITNKFVVVDIKTKKKLKNSVSLKQIKSQKKLSHLALIKQSRLSVMPIDEESWYLINKMAT